MTNPRSRTTPQPSAAPSHPKIRTGRKTYKKEPCCATFVSDVYLPHIRLRKRSWEVDERILRQHILPTFGSCPLESIQRASVEIWLYALARQGLAPATCNRILSVFKSLFTLAVSHNVLLFSPCACATISLTSLLSLWILIGFIHFHSLHQVPDGSLPPSRPSAS